MLVNKPGSKTCRSGKHAKAQVNSCNCICFDFQVAGCSPTVIVVGSCKQNEITKTK